MPWLVDTRGGRIWAEPAGAEGRRAVDDLAGRTANGSPTLQDNVVVEVVGQPGVTKQQLYYLAMSAANGIVRRFGNLVSFVPAYGRIAIEYDAASNWVRASISYKWSMLAMVAGGAGIDPPSIIALTNLMAVYRGPQCDVVGGNFDFVAPEAAGEAAIFRLPVGVPGLNFIGQPILTSCPTSPPCTPTPIREAPPPPVAIIGPRIPVGSQNPKPPGDNRSRGSVLAPSTGPGAPGTPGFTAVVTGTAAPTLTPFNTLPGPTPTNSGAICCPALKTFLPLVYAALTSPATDAKTTYPTPIPGPAGF